jgi:putative addiction module killer protein
MEYNPGSVEIRQTKQFAAWFAALRDTRTRARILTRIRRVSLGDLGDVRPVGEGVLELRVHWGPGYRIYVAQRGTAVVILLAGGTKGAQRRDIERARRLARLLEE